MTNPDLLLSGLDLDDGEKVIVEAWISEMEQVGLEIIRNKIAQAIDDNYKLDNGSLADAGLFIGNVIKNSNLAKSAIKGENKSELELLIPKIGNDATALMFLQGASGTLDKIKDELDTIKQKIEKTHDPYESLKYKLALVRYEKFLLKAQGSYDEAKNQIDRVFGKDVTRRQKAGNNVSMYNEIDEMEKIRSIWAESWETIKQSIMLANDSKISTTLEAADSIIKVMEKNKSKDVSQKTLDDYKQLNAMYENTIELSNKQVKKITQDLQDRMAGKYVSFFDYSDLEDELKKLREEVNNNLVENKSDEELEIMIETVTNSEIFDTKQALDGMEKNVGIMQTKGKINEAVLHKMGNDINVVGKSLAIINNLLQIYPEKEVHKVESDTNVSNLNTSMNDIKEYSQSMQDCVILGDEGNEVSKWIIAKLSESVDVAKKYLQALESNVKNLQEKYKGVKWFFKERLRDMFSKDALTRKVAWGKTPKWIDESKEKLAQVKQELPKIKM